MTMPPSHHNVSLDDVLRAVAAYYGVTTADGLADGSTLICAALIGSNDFISGKKIILESGLTLYEDSDATTFTPGTGTIAFLTNFNTQVLAGTHFYILTQSSFKALMALITVGNVNDVAPAVTDFDTNLVAADNFLNGGLMVFVTGALTKQPGHLVDIFQALNGNASFAAGDRWTAAPANGDRFIIIPQAGAYLKKIFAAIAAIPGDPWATPVPGAYGAGTAGKTLGNQQGVTQAGVHVHANNLLPQVVFEWTPLAARRKILAIWLDYVELTQNMAYLLSSKIDGVNYRVFDDILATPWTPAMNDGVLIVWNEAIDTDFKLEIQSAVLEGAGRNVPFRVIYEDM